MDAFFQQGLAELARKGGHDSWGKENARELLGEDQRQFVKGVQLALPPEFWNSLTPANQKTVMDRAAKFWAAGRQCVMLCATENAAPPSAGAQPQHGQIDGATFG